MNNNGKRKKLVNFDISLNDEQSIAKEKILHYPFNFIEGSVGTGKTLLAVQIALDFLFKKEYEKIIITRPTVGTEDNGYLPGTFEEKMEPWMVPIRYNMRRVYNHPEKLQKMEHDKDIELVSLSHFRGRSFDNAICIIDEFQNLTIQQLAMAIGRLGKDSKMIFCGDRYQIDLKYSNDSAIHGISRIKESQFVCHIELHENHRHPAINEVLEMLFSYK